MITLKDIAKKAKVSEATVSLALNDNDLVNIKTKERIKKTASEMGYMPNAIASSLAKNRSNVIGLIIPDIESVYYSKVVKIVEEKIRALGYNFMVTISNNSQKIEKKIISNLISQRVEGIIVAPVNKPYKDISYYKLLDKHRIPYVFITSYYDELEANVIMVDLKKGTYKLVDYLINSGHEKIAFLCGNRNVITTKLRIEGYKKAYDKNKMEYIEKSIIECSDLNYKEACYITQKLIDNNNQFDAIITINDEMAVGVLNTLLDNELKVPSDIAVAGYDNAIYSKMASVPITTVNQDLEELSNEAIKILFSKMGKETIEKNIVKINPDLIIRKSTSVNK